MNVLTQPLAHRLVELACRAPSVHNTQPWRWRISSDETIELWSDRDRQLTVADPDGRNLAISCGAALHHLVVAGHAMGVTTKVDLTPTPDDPDLLAWIQVEKGVPSGGATEVLDAIARRCTDRRRFTSWPVPDSRLTHLAQAAVGWGAFAIPILDASARFSCELLLSRAHVAQQSDHRFAQEQQAWTDRSAVDGVPLSHGAPRPRGSATYRNNRFAPESAGENSERTSGELGGPDRHLHSSGRPAGLARLGTGAQRPVAARNPGRVVPGSTEPGDRGARDEKRTAPRHLRRHGPPADPPANRLAGDRPRRSLSHTATPGGRRTAPLIP